MNSVYATLEMLPYTTVNGRKTRQALVQLVTVTGEWAGSFVVFGSTSRQIKDRAYAEADANASSKGYFLQCIREAT